MASVAGRGRGREPSDSINAKVLRRPGEAGLMQRLETLNTSMNATVKFCLFVKSKVIYIFD